MKKAKGVSQCQKFSRIVLPVIICFFEYIIMKVGICILTRDLPQFNLRPCANNAKIIRA